MAYTLTVKVLGSRAERTHILMSTDDPALTWDDKVNTDAFNDDPDAVIAPLVKRRLETHAQEQPEAAVPIQVNSKAEADATIKTRRKADIDTKLAAMAEAARLKAEEAAQREPRRP